MPLDSIETLDSLYQNKNDTSFPSFGELENIATDRFCTADSPFSFDNPIVMEKFLTLLLNYLQNISQHLVHLAYDITHKRLWPICLQLFDEGEPELKIFSLELLVSLIDLNCLPQSSEIKSKLVSLVFLVLQNCFSPDSFCDDNFRNSLVKMLTKLSSISQKDCIFKRITDQHTMELWNVIQFNCELVTGMYICTFERFYQF